jgi:hypothetical protein
MLRYLIVLAWRPVLLCVLVGCASRTAAPSSVAPAFSAAEAASRPTSMLPWVGGIATLGGIVALVLTRGGMGMRAIVVGVLLVILNDIMQRYADAFYLPILIGSAGVSLAYAWKTIRRATQERTKCTSGKSSSGQPPDTSGALSQRPGSGAPRRNSGSAADQ